MEMEIDGVTYTSHSSVVTADGTVWGYNCEAHIKPPSFIQLAIQIFLYGTMIGFGLSFIVIVLGIFLV